MRAFFSIRIPMLTRYLYIEIGVNFILCHNYFCLSAKHIKLNEAEWCIYAWSAPSPYLNQCSNIVNRTLRSNVQWNLNQNLYIFIQQNAFEKVVCELAAILSWPQCVKNVSIILAPLFSPYYTEYFCGYIICLGFTLQTIMAE